MQCIPNHAYSCLKLWLSGQILILFELGLCRKHAERAMLVYVTLCDNVTTQESAFSLTFIDKNVKSLLNGIVQKCRISCHTFDSLHLHLQEIFEDQATGQVFKQLPQDLANLF